MALPTSMMSSSLVPQETISCSVENVSSDLDKVEDRNAYSVVTSELARKPLGKISQLSYGDLDFDESQSSLSNASLKDIEISPAKQIPRERSIMQSLHLYWKLELQNLLLMQQVWIQAQGLQYLRVIQVI